MLQTQLEVHWPFSNTWEVQKKRLPPRPTCTIWISQCFSCFVTWKNPSKRQEKDTTRDFAALVEGNIKADEYNVVENIIDSQIFAKDEFYKNSPASLHYLVHWLNQPELEQTWEPVLGVKHLKRLILQFHHWHPKAVSSLRIKETRKQNAKAPKPESVTPEQVQPIKTQKKEKRAWTEENT